MVGCGNHNRFKLTAYLIEHLSEIAILLGMRIAVYSVYSVRRTHIHITQGDHLNHSRTGKIGYHLFTTVSDSDISHFYLIR